MLRMDVPHRAYPRMNNERRNNFELARAHFVESRMCCQATPSRVLNLSLADPRSAFFLPPSSYASLSTSTACNIDCHPSSSSCSSRDNGACARNLYTLRSRYYNSQSFLLLLQLCHLKSSRFGADAIPLDAFRGLCFVHRTERRDH